MQLHRTWNTFCRLYSVCILYYIYVYNYIHTHISHTHTYIYIYIYINTVYTVVCVAHILSFFMRFLGVSATGMRWQFQQPPAENAGFQSATVTIGSRESFSTTGCLALKCAGTNPLNPLSRVLFGFLPDAQGFASLKFVVVARFTHRQIGTVERQISHLQSSVVSHCRLPS